MLELLDAKNIVALFSSLLLERRIILVAKSLSVLSSTVQALVALLYPFTWQVFNSPLSLCLSSPPPPPNLTYFTLAHLYSNFARLTIELLLCADAILCGDPTEFSA